MDDRWSFRPATADDAALVAGGEQACFADPWLEAGIREMLQDETVIGVLARDPRAKSRLAGYLLARTIAGEGEVLTLGVHPDHRRAGLGRALLAEGIARMVAAGARVVFLEVRESNRGARALYESAGFRPSGVRPHYYRRPRENALVLRWAADALA
jgi:[ribosomal protein S18]-alanine N-acetyltransferase